MALEALALGTAEEQHGKLIEDLRVKLGPGVTILEAAGEIVGVKSPSRVAYSRFREYMMDDRRKVQANEALVIDCLVYPPAGSEREAIFDRRPALIDTFANELIKMAGGGADAKKF
jgi:hypothetical protein